MTLIDINERRSVQHMKYNNTDCSPYNLAKKIIQNHHIVSLEGNLCIYIKKYNYWKNLRDENYDKQIRLLIPEEYRSRCNHNTVIEILFWLDTLVDTVDLSNDTKRNRCINFKDAYVDVISSEVKKHDSDLFFQHYVNTKIPRPKDWTEREISESVYTRFTNTVFQGKYKELRTDFEELLGLILSPQRSLKIASIFWGKSNTGKTVALNLISNLLENVFVSHISFSQFSEEFAVANLGGKALNISGEISGIKERRIDLFNSVVGNDTVMACFKGKNHFKLKNNAFLAFACNELPVIQPEMVEAFSARVVIFPFMNVVPREDWIENMDLELKDEIDLVCERAIQGLRRFVLNGNCFTHQKRLDTIKAEALYRLNSFRAFAEECLVSEKKNFISSKEIGDAYEVFCEERDIEMYCVQQWSRYLRQMFPDIRKVTRKDENGTQKRGYEGIRFRTSEDIQERKSKTYADRLLEGVRRGE